MEDLEEPTLTAGDVLVRPLFNGICFTDKHLFDGSVTRPSGLILGHEFSAEVLEVGTGVTEMASGDLVSIEPRLRCGECLACRAGLEMLCSSGRFLGVFGAHGGLAERCVVPSYCLYPLPQHCSPLQAACVEAACCATRVARSGAVMPGDNVVLLGLEDYNLYLAQWLKGQGAVVIGVDPVAVRREAALGFGASRVLDPSAQGWMDEIRKRMPFGADMISVAMEDYLDEASDYLRQAHRLARSQGQIVVMRSYGSTAYSRIDPKVPWLKELTVRYFGNFFGNEPARGGRSRGDWQVTLEAIAGGALAAPPPLAQIVPFSVLEDSSAVAAMMQSIPAEASKVIVDMSG
jgi:(R,R)-butanediol dehydrogenase/meso-butanediol dehydrogenase/diacetyl reductase